ncbi:hypothetical protein LX36DRAFT_181296 [Colletotrichum falcatum]|nr:hypothetical protein LX36DRAFT_181296 [Colletotrichum falcatum]
MGRHVSQGRGEGDETMMNTKPPRKGSSNELLALPRPAPPSPSSSSPGKVAGVRFPRGYDSCHEFPEKRPSSALGWAGLGLPGGQCPRRAQRVWLPRLSKPQAEDGNLEVHEVHVSFNPTLLVRQGPSSCNKGREPRREMRGAPCSHAGGETVAGRVQGRAYA